MVLSVDEKSGTQALDRTQPGFPMTPGQAERGTHEYGLNGTTSLLDAVDVATGKVIGRCHRTHRHQEFVKFLDEIAAANTSPRTGSTWASPATECRCGAGTRSPRSRPGRRRTGGGPSGAAGTEGRSGATRSPQPVVKLGLGPGVGHGKPPCPPVVSEPRPGCGYPGYETGSSQSVVQHQAVGSDQVGIRSRQA